ncbi:MAG: hypothetical protein II882_01715 [Lachnospiraceae bacterium]|nr:hypothetical protein [Lachnospiraceae bacterium]
MAVYVFLRMIRRFWLTLAGLVIAAAFCFVLCYLVRYRSEQEASLKEVCDSYELVCVVTDSRGTRSEKLALNRRFSDFVMDKDNGLGNYVRALRMTMEFGVKSPIGSGRLIGVSDMKALDRLNPALGGHCTYTVDDFFGSSDAICLVPEESYSDFEGEILTVRITLTGIGGVEEFADNQYRVVGWYRGTGADLIIPYNTASRLTSTAGAGFCDSLSFVLADNSKADEMMEKAMQVFTVVDPASYSSRPALTLKDRQYKATIAELEQNIRRTNSLLPVSVLLSLAIGFLIGFVSVRGETRTYALMRTLGVSGVKLVIMVLAEQVLLPAAGVAAVGWLLGQTLTALFYFGCHLIGCTLAVLRPALAPPTKLLRDQT